MNLTAGRRRLVAALALAYALLAVASGLDRYSEQRPSVARLVPTMMQSNGFAAEAGEALRGRELEVAVARAGDAINRDPLDPRGHGLLGSGFQLLGNTKRAETAFVMAASLGWRQPLTQSFWFFHEWRRGNAEGAMLRLDALLRSHPEFEPAKQFLTVMESRPSGQAALAGRLASDTRWTRAYLAALDVSDAVLRNRARFIASEQGRGVSLGCERSLPLVRELIVRSFRRDAEKVLGRHCPSAREQGALADPDFASVGATTRTGLGWRQQGGGDVLVSPPSTPNGGVSIANRSSVTQLALTQPVALEPGHYRIRVKAGAGASSRLRFSIDCGIPKRPPLAEGDASGDGIMLLVGDCPDQLLGIWLRPGSNPVNLKRISLQASSEP